MTLTNGAIIEIIVRDGILGLICYLLISRVNTRLDRIIELLGGKSDKP